MKSKKLTVTVGIPAYNEEANIGQLIESILKQKQTNYILEKIIVVSDMSTDNTDKVVNKYRNKKVVLLANKERLGKALSQNVISKHSKSDILIIFDADVLPKSSLLFSHLVGKFTSNANRKIGIVAGKPLPVNGQTFVEKVINHSAIIKLNIYEAMRNKNNVYLCQGRIRAFSKDLYKKIKWEKSYGEDAFSYFSCISFGFNFVYDDKAVVLYKSPDSVKDHLKQSVRFINSKQRMKKYFPKININNEYHIPKFIFVKSILSSTYKNFIYTVVYAVLYLVAKSQSKLGVKTSASWNMSKSTKRII